MCAGDDPTCHAFEEHRRRFRRDLEPERRAFLKSGFAATGAAAAALAAGGPSLVSPALAQASGAKIAATAHYHLPANAETVHWGFFSPRSRSVRAISSRSRRSRIRRATTPSG